MSFHDLNIKKPVLQALDELGYTEPTPIQLNAFAPIMSGRDVLGLAQTGTGKTLAYLIPNLCLWKFTKEPHPQILIVVPTRELVAQVVEECEKLIVNMNVVVTGVYGGANINTQAAAILQGLDIIVGTPGRLVDLAANGSLQLKNIKRVVIDEVDETLSEGFQHQLDRLLQLLPEKFQAQLFSATLSEEVAKFIDKNFNDPIRVEAAKAGTPIEKIKQEFYTVPNFLTKVNLLNSLLSANESFNKVLVFVSSRAWADRLFSELTEIHGEQVGVIHSNKSQNYRFNAVNSFQAGEFRVLIATDLIARGIDVSEVSQVINFDLPDSADNFIHRVGRTGRAGQIGHAITFVSESQMENWQQIQGVTKISLTEMEIPSEVEIVDELLEIEKPVVQMKNVLVKLPKKSEAGPAFHEKKDKNKKVNVRYNHKKAMQEKYGKPKKRGSKKK
jgi:ATP-dependent RNA helicase RhlE